MRANGSQVHALWLLVLRAWHFMCCSVWQWRVFASSVDYAWQVCSEWRPLVVIAKTHTWFQNMYMYVAHLVQCGVYASTLCMWYSALLNILCQSLVVIIQVVQVVLHCLCGVVIHDSFTSCACVTAHVWLRTVLHSLCDRFAVRVCKDSYACTRCSSEVLLAASQWCTLSTHKSYDMHAHILRCLFDSCLHTTAVCDRFAVCICLHASIVHLREVTLFAADFSRQQLLRCSCLREYIYASYQVSFPAIGSSLTNTICVHVCASHVAYHSIHVKT